MGYKQEYRRKGSYEVMLELWQEKLLNGKMTRTEIINYTIWRILKKKDFYGVCTRQEVIDEMKEYIPQLFYDKEGDRVNLAQGIYEDGFQKGYIHKTIEILKKNELYEEFEKDKVKEDLIKSLIDEEESGVCNRESALEAIKKYAPELIVEE